MPEGWRYWTVTGLAALTLVLVLTNMLLFQGNRALQVSVNTRGQYIQQSVQLEALGREIVTAIANLAVQQKDDQLRGILDAHGIRINAPAVGDAPGPSGPAVPPAARSGAAPAPVTPPAMPR